MRSEEQTWNPGHSIKGEGYYPFILRPSSGKFFNETNPDINEVLKELGESNQQIIDMLEEHPFNPETFGFDIAYKSVFSDEVPVKIYVSRYDPKFSLFRKPGLPDDPWYNPMVWILTEKNDDGSFKESELKLPCQRIAYAALWSLGVDMNGPLDKIKPLQNIIERTFAVAESAFFEDSIKEATKNTEDDLKKQEEYLMRTFTMPKESAVTSGIFPLMKSEIEELSSENKQELAEDHEFLIALTTQKRNTSHRVFFKRKDTVGTSERTYRRIEDVDATDDKEALTKAKFLLETDTDHPVTDVMFEELTIVK